MSHPSKEAGESGERRRNSDSEPVLQRRSGLAEMLTRAGEERFVPLLDNDQTLVLLDDISARIAAGEEIIKYPQYGLNVIKVEPPDLRGIYGLVSAEGQAISYTGIGRELSRFLKNSQNQEIKLILIHGVAMEISPGKLPSYQRGLTQRGEFSPEDYWTAAIQGTDLGHEGDIDILILGRQNLTLQEVKSRIDQGIGMLIQTRIVASASRPGFTRLEIGMKPTLYRPGDFSHLGSERERVVYEQLREREFNDPFVQMAFCGDTDGIYRSLGLAHYLATHGSLPNPVLLTLDQTGNVVGARLDFFPRISQMAEEVEYTQEGRRYKLNLTPSYYCCPEVLRCFDPVTSAAVVIRENKTCWAGSGGGIYPIAKGMDSREFMEWLAVNVWRPAGDYIWRELDKERRDRVLKSMYHGFTGALMHNPEFAIGRFWDIDFEDPTNRFNVFGSEMIKNIFPGLHHLLSEGNFLTSLLEKIRNLPKGEYHDFVRVYTNYLRNLITRREFYLTMVESSLLFQEAWITLAQKRLGLSDEEIDEEGYRRLMQSLYGF
ncbi:MAG: hypothetical protein WC686_05680 [Candidatus Shapirobacteria bacterium]|jgi:hypothetical protein